MHRFASRKPSRRVDLAAALILMAFLGALGCTVGNLDVADGTRRGGIDFAAGNVTIGADCTIEGDIELKAGNLTVGPRTLVEGRTHVSHGNVEFATGARATGIQVSNGLIDLADEVQVAGTVSLKNGLIRIGAASVEGRVSLGRGRLEVGGGARLAGGLAVENRDGGQRDSTVVVIEPGARIEGSVLTAGAVRLEVSRRAETAGARFSGNSPQFTD